MEPVQQKFYSSPNFEELNWVLENKNMEVVQQNKFILNHLYRKCKLTSEIGELAQLVEHRFCKARVRGSSPLFSTNKPSRNQVP